MARYALLRMDDDGEADHLLRTLVVHAGDALMSPGADMPVGVELVADLDPSDFRSPRGWNSVQETDEARAVALAAVCRESYLRASELAAEWEAAS